MFFDFPEIVIICGVALVVLGPKKLPGAARQVGRWVGRARTMARQFREQLEQEINSVESALDTNAKPQQTSQPSTSPGAAAPETPAPASAVATEPAAPPAASEVPAEDPSFYAATGTDWHPGYVDADGNLSPYGDPTGNLAPYGDPDAIPEPESSEEQQLSLQLDAPREVPPAAAQARPAAANRQSNGHALADEVTAGSNEGR